MHLYLTLKQLNKSAQIPINYNYFIQSAIYANLEPGLACRIHDRGYQAGSRKYKLFTFSKLLGRFVFNQEQRTISFPDGAVLVISSPDADFIESFVNTVLQKPFLRVDQADFEISGVETKGYKILTGTVKLKTLSPVVVYSTLIKPEGSKYTCFYQAGEPEWTRLVGENLRKKYNAFYDKTPPEGEIMVRLINRPRLHVMNYKNTVIKGYTNNLELTGPRELLQMGYDAGLGSKGSQGFGCVELLE